MLIHLILEKLGGPFKGDIEGLFFVEGEIDKRLPLIYLGNMPALGLVFTQGNKTITMIPIDGESVENYDEHFQYGINFLIKEWTDGGRIATDSQNPN